MTNKKDKLHDDELKIRIKSKMKQDLATVLKAKDIPISRFIRELIESELKKPENLAIINDDADMNTGIEKIKI